MLKPVRNNTSASKRREILDFWVNDSFKIKDKLWRCQTHHAVVRRDEGTLCFIWPSPSASSDTEMDSFVYLFSCSWTAAKMHKLKSESESEISDSNFCSSHSKSSLEETQHAIWRRPALDKSCPPSWRWFVLASFLIPTICVETCQAFLAAQPVRNANLRHVSLGY